jgi:phage/plasmid-associated DNA primase
MSEETVTNAGAALADARTPEDFLKAVDAVQVEHSPIQTPQESIPETEPFDWISPSTSAGSCQTSPNSGATSDVTTPEEQTNTCVNNFNDPVFLENFAEYKAENPDLFPDIVPIDQQHKAYAVILEDQIILEPEEKTIKTLNETDGTLIDQKIDQTDGHKAAFFQTDPKTYKETPIREAIADFIHRWLKTVSFNERIYCYNRNTGVYSPDTGQVNAIINEFARRCDQRDLIPSMQSFVKKILIGKSVYMEYPFNRPSHRIPFKNWTLHLNANKTRWLKKDKSAADMVTWRIPYDYVPSAPEEPVIKVLKEWTNDEDMKILVQIPAHALFHQALKQPFKTTYLLIGETDAAKSTFLVLLEMAFRGMISKVPLQLIGSKFKNADMEGKLFNAYDDLKSTAINNTGEFKTHRGKFEHSIEHKGEMPYDGFIKCVYIFSSNPPLPKVDEVNDDAFFGSWKMIVFEHKFPRDPTWCERTFTEEFIAGFFNLILREYISIMHQGLLDQQTAEEVRDLWLGTTDEKRFVDATLESKPENEIDVDLCYDLYVKYKMNKKEVPKDKSQFGKGIMYLGITKHRPRKGDEKKHKAVYRGIGLKPGNEQPPQPEQPQQEIIN